MNIQQLSQWFDTKLKGNSFSGNDRPILQLFWDTNTNEIWDCCFPDPVVAEPDQIEIFRFEFDRDFDMKGFISEIILANTVSDYFDVPATMTNIVTKSSIAYEKWWVEIKEQYINNILNKIKNDTTRNYLP